MALWRLCQNLKPNRFGLVISYSRQLVHQWRAEEQAILVGANTVVQDNPSLTTREVEGANPIRIVIDLKNSLAETYQVFNSDAKTIRLTSMKYYKNHWHLKFVRLYIHIK